MGQFLDYDREQRIMNKVMERFIENVDIEIVNVNIYCVGIPTFNNLWTKKMKKTSLVQICK